MMSKSDPGEGLVVWADHQALHEMSDVSDAEVSRAGGDARDGGRWKALVSRETVSDAKFTLGLYWLRPGERHLVHHHKTAAEFYYVVSGRGRFTLGDRQVEGRPGLTLYIPPGVKHAIDNDGDDELCIIWGFDCGDLADSQMIWDE
jgi:mannose-6-phosphate isomerase-like protein (cupin superfamily)